MEASTINTLNFIFALGTLLSLGASIILLIGLMTRDKSSLYAWTAKNALVLVFLIAFAGMAGSLTYQFVGFAPCAFCWYQRILMYPIAIVTLVALAKKKSLEILDYVFVLSVIGGLIALWHNIEKFLGKDVLACDVTGTSCLIDYVKAFGFIDIPVMSLVFFVLIILVIVNKRRLESK